MRGATEAAFLYISNELWKSSLIRKRKILQAIIAQPPMDTVAASLLIRMLKETERGKVNGH